MSISALCAAAILLVAVPAQQIRMTTYQLVVFRANADMPPDDAQMKAMLGEHLAGMAELNRKRVNLLYGPMLDDGPLRAIAVLDAGSPEAARALLENDPLVKSGTLLLEIKPWMAPEGWFGVPIGYDVHNPQHVEHLVFGVLVSGPNRSHGADESAAIQKGHLAYMGRLAEQGQLVAAGPFADKGDWRGVVIYRVPTVERARELAAGDPAVKAGRLVLEAHPWMTLRGILK